MWDGKVDYVSTVKEHKPFEETQGLDGTFADVLEKYVSPPDWEVRESGDIHYVDISGVIKETDYELVVTIKVSPNSDNADKVKIEPESVVFDNEKFSTKNDAVEFLYNMFSAYNEGYGDLSELLSGTDSQEITLSETYTNDEEGISFNYPSALVPVSGDELTDRLGNIEDEEYPLILLANESEDLPEEDSYIMVSKFDATQDMIDHLFVDDEQFAATFDHDVTIEDTSTTEIDGVAARKIAYIGKDGNGRQSYFYAVDSVLYRIDFSYRGESAGNKQRFFDAIIDSYKIMSVEKTFMDDTLSPGNEKAGQPVDDTVDELFYMGIPIDTILEMSAEDMIAAFGKPDERDESFLCCYDAGIIAAFGSMGVVSSFGGNPEKFKLNGQNLDQDHNGLVETFGREPDFQEMSDLLEIKWFYDDYSILIGLDDDGLPGKVNVLKKYTMDEAQQLIYDWIEATHQLGIVLPEYVDEGIMYDGRSEVYNFNLMVDEEVWVPVSVEKDTGMIWAVPDDGSDIPLDEYYNDYYGNADAAVSGLPNGFMWIEEPTGKTDDLATYITGII